MDSEMINDDSERIKEEKELTFIKYIPTYQNEAQILPFKTTVE